MDVATEQINPVGVFVGADVPNVIFQIDFGRLPEESQEKLKGALGDDDDSPDWTNPQSITVGCAMGAARINRLVWQGDVCWNVNSVFE